MDILTFPLWVQFVLVTVSVAILDMCWTFYIAHVASKKAFKASVLSSLIILISAFVALSYIHRHILVVAAGLGAFIGTYFAVWYEGRKQAKT